MSFYQKIASKLNLQEFYHLKPSVRHWSIPFLASMSVGLPMIFGFLLDNFEMALTVSLAGLVILYRPTDGILINRLNKMLLCSFGFVVSFGIGIAFSFNPYVSYISFGVFSGLVHWVTLSLKMRPPGNFFFIMLAATASGLPFDADTIPLKIGLISMGTILATFISLLASIFILKNNVNDKMKSDDIVFNSEADVVESLIIAFFMFLSLWIGYLLDLENPYWIPISCLAVMQGTTTHHIWRRGVSRILGTVIGMFLCWLILMFIQEKVWMILQFIIEYFITRNYAIAVIFITPITILLFEIAHPISQVPTEIIAVGMIDVLIGGVGGWIIYNEKFRFEFVKQIRNTKSKLKKLNLNKKR